MKYKLNVLDRIIIPNILPRESTVVEQTAIKEIRAKIRLKAEDYEKFGIKEKRDPMNSTSKIFDPDTLDPEQNPKVLEEFECELSKTETTIIKEAAKKVEEGNKVSQFNLDTLTKIGEMRG
jgi:hypothetical protein